MSVQCAAYFAAAQEWQRLTARLAESNLLLRSLVGMAQNWRWIVFIASSNWPWQWVEAVPLSLLHALLNQERDCWTPSFRFFSVLVPSCSIFDPGIRHQDAPRIPGEGAARRQWQKRGSKFASGPRCGRRTVMRTVQGAAARRVPSWNGFCRGHPGPKRQWWGQMMPDGGCGFDCLMMLDVFVWFQIESWEKRRLNVFVVFPPKRNRNVVLQNCISMYFLVMGQSMVVNHSNFGLPWCCTVGWPSHLIHLNAWLVGYGWLTCKWGRPI